MRRGEIFFVDFGPERYDFGERSNKEPARRRPVVILSINEIIDLSERTLVLVSVVPGTNGANVPKDYDSQVRVPAEASGLPLETVFRAFQITSMDSRRFTAQPVGRLPNAYMKRLEDAVGYILGLAVEGRVRDRS